MRNCRILLAASLFVITIFPPFAYWLKEEMARHMLMQIPMLVLVGILLAPRTERHSGEARAIVAVLLAAFCLAFWMLPRWLDAAVADAWVDAAKILSLIVLAGLPLGWGWRGLGTVARGFVWAQLLGMLLVLGVFYVSFPARLCNNYLESDQTILGWAMLGIAGVLGVYCAISALFDLRLVPWTPR